MDRSVGVLGSAGVGGGHIQVRCFIRREAREAGACLTQLELPPMYNLLNGS